MTQETTSENLQSLLHDVLTKMRDANLITDADVAVWTGAASKPPAKSKRDTSATRHAVRDGKGRFTPRAQTTPPEAVAPEAVAPEAAKPQKPAKPRLARVPEHVDDFVTWFFKAPEHELRDVACGQYSVVRGSAELGTAHTLKFTSTAACVSVDQRRAGADIIGIRPLGSTAGIFNAASLRYGVSKWRARVRPQAVAEDAGAIPIPFSAVADTEVGAGLDLAKLEIVDWRGSEQLVIPPANAGFNPSAAQLVERHFAGATLVRVGQEYFLFDTDRNELNINNFNPFFTKLPRPASTVAEAYATLVPADVQKAIDAGKAVVRQGEYFFVPCEAQELPFTRLCTDDSQDYRELLWFEAMCKQHGSLVCGCWHLQRQHASRFEQARQEERLTPAVAAAHARLQEFHSKQAYDICDPTYVPLLRLWDADLGRDRNPQFAYIHAGLAASVSQFMRYRCTPLTVEESKAVDEHVIHSGYGLYMRLRNSTPDSSLANATIFEGALQHDAEQRGTHVATGIYMEERTPGTPVYVIGAVTHSGRQHMPLFLRTWHRVYHNTSTMNLQVSGAVD